MTGLPSSEWPALAGVPGVWCRLAKEVALALQALHQAGLVHGHLNPDLLLLTSEGRLKLCGLGEPAWLVTLPQIEGPEDTAADLAALGHIATDWAKLAVSRKGAKALPESLQSVVNRLVAEDPAQRYASADELLKSLQEILLRQSPSNEAWEQLVHHVREQMGEQSSLRQSA